MDLLNHEDIYSSRHLFSVLIVESSFFMVWMDMLNHSDACASLYHEDTVCVFMKEDLLGSPLFHLSLTQFYNFKINIVILKLIKWIHAI